MANIIMKLYIAKHIGTKEEAEGFFKILEKYDILPDKIGRYEPLKESYSLSRAIEIWTLIGGYEPDFRRGAIIGKRKEPNVRLYADWSVGENARPNTIALWFTKKSFKQLRDKIKDLFKDLIFYFDGFYGYITDFGRAMHQHATGVIEERLHGVFWCNYFSKIYVDFFGKEKILNASWFKTEVLDNGGIITYLAKEPDKELLDAANLLTSPDPDQRKMHNKLELKVKEELGKDSFAEPWDEQAVFTGEEVKTSHLRNPPQQKNVPKIDFSEIRRPISDFKK